MTAPLILAIDASTYAGSAALLRGSDVLAECTVAMRGEREERLMPAIAAMLDQAGAQATSLDALACGAGPGSFTSLRIAASIAKGMAISLDRPLYAVSSLLLVATGAVPPLAAGRYAVMLDAMRGDVYAVTVEVDTAGIGQLVSRTEVIPSGSASAYAESANAAAIGPGVGVGLAPHARGFAPLTGADLHAKGLTAVDLDSWEPDYGRLAEAQVKWEAAHGRALSQG